MTVQLRRLAAVLACCLLLCPRVFAQTIQEIDPAKLPRFEVASIKVSPDTSATAMRVMPTGMIQVQHMPVSRLITIAYQLQPFQLVGAPRWTSDTFYDIVAKPAARSNRAQAFEMMQALLADRVHLAFHREQRKVNGFALVRDGAALGPKLHSSTIDCDAERANLQCREGGRTPTSLNVSGAHLWTLIQVLVSAEAAPVSDETQLTGAYDIDLRWNNDFAVASDSPSIETAIRERLGLKLEHRRVPVDVLVIDHIERPDPD